MNNDMKDRIRQIMESQHMNQQVFADFIGTTPATLSGIFNNRTRPSISIVESIKKSIPNISTDWLLFGTGDMYRVPAPAAEENVGSSAQLPPYSGSTSQQSYSPEPMLDFGSDSTPTPPQDHRAPLYPNSVRNTRSETPVEVVKIVDKPQRRVTEIRVYYDDQTWESFVPSKK